MKNFSWKYKIEEMFGLDVRAMAFLRISFACLILADLLQRSFHIKRDYTDNGILPLSVFKGSHIASIHLMNGSLEYQIFLLIVAGIFALGMLAGYQTKLCTIVSWILLASLQNRNVMVLNGGDVYFRMLLFWGMFMPWGSKYSIDSLRNPEKIKEYTHSSLATFGFILQVCVIYFIAGISKNNDTWKNGTALYYILSYGAYTKPFGQLMLHYPAYLIPAGKCVPYIEKYLPFLLISTVLTPCFRIMGVTLIIFMHLSIMTLLELKLFPLICITAAVGLLPKICWDKIPFLKQTDTDNKETALSVNNQPRTWINRIVHIITETLKTIFLTACLIYIVNNDFSFLSKTKIKFPKQYTEFGSLLNLNQHWALFSGDFSVSKWCIIRGILKNGQKINGVTGEPLNLNKSRIGDNKFHWWEHDNDLLNFLTKNYKGVYDTYYAHFLCQDWNLSHQNDRRMIKVVGVLLQQVTLLNDQKKPPQKIVFINYSCP